MDSDTEKPLWEEESKRRKRRACAPVAARLHPRPVYPPGVVESSPAGRCDGPGTAPPGTETEAHRRRQVRLGEIQRGESGGSEFAELVGGGGGGGSNDTEGLMIFHCQT